MESRHLAPLSLYAASSQVYKCNFETASLRMAISFYSDAAAIGYWLRVEARATQEGQDAHGRSSTGLKPHHDIFCLNVSRKHSALQRRRRRHPFHLAAVAGVAARARVEEYLFVFVVFPTFRPLKRLRRAARARAR